MNKVSIIYFLTSVNAVIYSRLNNRFDVIEWWRSSEILAISALDWNRWNFLIVEIVRDWDMLGGGGIIIANCQRIELNWFRFDWFEFNYCSRRNQQNFWDTINIFNQFFLKDINTTWIRFINLPFHITLYNNYWIFL